MYIGEIKFFRSIFHCFNITMLPVCCWLVGRGLIGVFSIHSLVAFHRMPDTNSINSRLIHFMALTWWLMEIEIRIPHAFALKTQEEHANFAILCKTTIHFFFANIWHRLASNEKIDLAISRPGPTSYNFLLYLFVYSICMYVHIMEFMS